MVKAGIPGGIQVNPAHVCRLANRAGVGRAKSNFGMLQRLKSFVVVGRKHQEFVRAYSSRQ